jgi:hypothetical protein
VAAAKTVLMKAGMSGPTASLQANGEIYRTLSQQSMALAYVDVIRIFCVCCVLALPLLLLARRPKQGAGPAMAH